MKNEIAIYCDVDGCLANLAKSVSQHLDYEVENSMGSPEPVEEALINFIAQETNLKPLQIRCNDHPELISQFWAELPWISNGPVLWRSLLKTGCKLKIITALPRNTKTTNFPGTETGKRTWCEQLKIKPDMVLVVPFGTKGTYVDPDYKSILIDDHRGNIEDWKAAGGIGILHHNDNIRHTLDQLLYYL